MKWLLRILFLVVVAFGLVIGALLLMPGDKLAAILAKQVKNETGRELTLSGDVNLSFWPVLGVETGPVTFGNAPWAGSEPMLSAESLAVGVDAAGLWNGDFRIRRVFADQPILRLELSDGRGNWEMSAASSQPSSGSSTAPSEASEQGVVILDRLELTNARLIYIENGATTYDFTDVDLSARWPSPADPMVMEAQMAVPGGKVKVDLKILDLPAYASGAVTPLQLALAAPGGELGFDGRVNIAGEMDGILEVKTKSTEKMLAAFGQAGVGVPLGLGRAADVSGHMTYTSDGRISLRNLVAQLDHNRFTGEADIEISDPPKITARLEGGDIDLSRYNDAPAPTGGGSGTASAPDSGWSTDTIDASALALANGEIRLTASSIAVPELTLGPSDLTLSLDRSRAVLTMNPATLFAGQVKGQVVANNRNGLSVGGTLNAQGIDLQQALSAMAGINRLTGAASGEFEFLGIGQTEDQIMRSLSGKGSLNVGQGVISGFDLDRLMGRGKGTGGTTVFNSLTASFNADQGILTNSDLLMSLDNYRADGTGQVNIGAQTIDYLFTPTALRANSGQGLSVPVRVVGPWSDPSIKPDLTKVIEAAAEGQLKGLEGDAKQKVLDKVSDELGTVVTDTESAEDALRNKLEEEARKGLLKLLGAD